MKQIDKTHISQRRDWANGLKRRILDLLGWDDLQFGQVQYEQGLQYLATYLFGYEYEADMISRSRIFWNWWKNHWAVRDESFLCFALMIETDKNTYRQLYISYHDGRLLGKKLTLPGIVLNECYATMITDLVEDETKKKEMS